MQRSTESNSKKPHMTDREWWEVDDDRRVGEAVMGAIKDAQKDAKTRETEQLAYLRLYGNKRMKGLRGTDVIRQSQQVTDQREPSPFNIVRRITDAARNRVGKTLPTVRVLTSRANWEQRQQAKELGRLVEGAFYAGNLRRVGTIALTLGILLGDSAIKVVEDGKRIRYEWVYPFEVVVPLNEQLYGEPRELYQIKWVPRSRLARKFPDQSGKILELDRLVEVWEAWRLPESEEEPGRHVIVTASNLVLLDEVWTDDEFPFAWFHLFPEPGFWSAGLGQLLLPFQYSINLINRTISRNIKAGGNLKVVIESGSVTPNHITNVPGDILEVKAGTGLMPQWVVNPVVSPDLQREREFTIAQAWEECGFSQTAGAAMKPAGLNSGIALLTYADQQTERQALMGKAWEDLFVDLARLTIQAARRIHSEVGSYVVTWPGKSATETATMKDAMLDPDGWQLRVYSASRLPDTLSGRLQFLTELVETGLFTDRQVVLRLLDFPDVEAEIEEATGPLNLAEQLIARILRGEQPVAPNEYLDLQTLHRKSNLAFTHAQLDGAPPGVLDGLSTLIAQTQAMLDKATQAQLEQQAVGQPPPPPVPSPEATGEDPGVAA